MGILTITLFSSCIEYYTITTMNPPSRPAHPLRRGSWNDYSAYSISDVKSAYANHKNPINIDQVCGVNNSRYYDELSSNPFDLDRVKVYTKYVNDSWTRTPKRDRHSQSKKEADAESHMGITVVFLNGSNHRRKNILLKIFFVSMQKNAACSYARCDSLWMGPHCSWAL